MSGIVHRLLVIEDDSAMRFALGRLALGTSVEMVFASLQEALTMEPNFAAVLSDDSALLGPGEKVPLTLLKERLACPVVLLTVTGNRRIEGYARQCGASVVLFKPFSMGDLRKAVWTLLGLSEEQKPAINSSTKGPVLAAVEFTPADMGSKIAGDEAFDIMFEELEKRQPLQEGLDAFDVVERQLIKRALQACEGNQSQTARFLGITRNTLRKRIKKYGFGGLILGDERLDEEEA